MTILYSFRRCPYAMRARMALAQAQTRVELREVQLKKKPPSLLQYSAKGTVPVLITSSGTVIDESLDIMFWAIGEEHPWLMHQGAVWQRQYVELFDREFKPWLDAYKYRRQDDVASADDYRNNNLPWLTKLDHRLAVTPYLLGEQEQLVDVAILPFVRQFAFVDEAWFFAQEWPFLQAWLRAWLTSEHFLSVMPKFAPWLEGSRGLDWQMTVEQS